jgi:hypothetical protein
VDALYEGLMLVMWQAAEPVPFQHVIARLVVLFLSPREGLGADASWLDRLRTPSAEAAVYALCDRMGRTPGYYDEVGLRHGTRWGFHGITGEFYLHKPAILNSSYEVLDASLHADLAMSRLNGRWRSEMANDAVLRGLKGRLRGGANTWYTGLTYVNLSSMPLASMEHALWTGSLELVEMMLQHAPPRRAPDSGSYLPALLEFVRAQGGTPEPARSAAAGVRAHDVVVETVAGAHVLLWWMSHWVDMAQGEFQEALQREREEAAIRWGAETGWKHA